MWLPFEQLPSRCYLDGYHLQTGLLVFLLLSNVFFKRDCNLLEFIELLDHFMLGEIMKEVDILEFKYSLEKFDGLVSTVLDVFDWKTSACVVDEYIGDRFGYNVVRVDHVEWMQ